MTASTEIQILPYAKIDGVRTFTDSFIRSLFVRTVESGMWDMVFYNGRIDSPDKFLTYMKNGPAALYINVKNGEVSSYFWLSDIEDKTAYLNYCSLPVTRYRNTVKIGRHNISFLLNRQDGSGNYILDMLLGLTPVRNKTGVRFAKLCGAHILGTLPLGAYIYSTGKSEPAVLSYFVR